MIAPESLSSVFYGYAEGYYGQLFSWSERIKILDALAANGMNTYYYAPKEDALHRWQWRTPYSQAWRSGFSQFCAAAKDRGITVVAGIAPGLDFNFHDLSAGPDKDSLVNKAKQLRRDGADVISLLVDDIDADFAQRSAGLMSEGLAHARLANELAQSLSEPLWVTPRIYANELIGEAPDYLPAFLGELETKHHVLYCGSDIVSRVANTADIQKFTPKTSHGFILWDNLYANDYCPRRLYVGPWQGREAVRDVLLNPTGHVYTDCLLLELMHNTRQLTSGSNEDEQLAIAWTKTMQRHGVPEAFAKLAPYFNHPVFNDVLPAEPPQADADTFDALEQCLWRWKTPLSREWYAYLFGLKHDLQMASEALPRLRIKKTQNLPLADYLTGGLPRG